MEAEAEPVFAEEEEAQEEVPEAEAAGPAGGGSKKRSRKKKPKAHCSVLEKLQSYPTRGAQKSPIEPGKSQT